MSPIPLAAAFVMIPQLAGAQPYQPGVTVQFKAPPLVTPQVIPVPGRVVDHRAPEMLCTMPMLRPPANVDPKIVVEPPKNGAKIRAIVVPPCVERATR